MTTENQNTRDELAQLSLPHLQARFREVIGETTRCPNRRFLVRRIEEALAARQEQAPAEGEHVIDEPAAELASPQADTIEMTSVPTPEEHPPADTIEMPSVTLLDEADDPAASMEPGEFTPHEAQGTADTIEMPSVTPLDEADPPAETVETTDASAEPSPEANMIETATMLTGDPASQSPHTVEAPAVPSANENDPPAGLPEASSQPAPDADPPTPRQRGRFGSMTIEELRAKYIEVVGRPTGSSDRNYLIWKVREAEKGRITIGPRTTPERSGEPLDVKVLPLRLEAAIIERMDEAWRTRGIKSRMEFLRRAIGHYLTHVGADDAATMLVGGASD